LPLIFPARTLSKDDLPEPGGPNSRHMRPCRVNSSGVSKQHNRDVMVLIA